MAGAAACCWAKLRPTGQPSKHRKKKQEQSKKLLFGDLRKIWGTLGIFFMTRVKQKGGREEGEGGLEQFQLCNVFASSLSPQSSHTDKHTQCLTKSSICIQNIIKSRGCNSKTSTNTLRTTHWRRTALVLCCQESFYWRLHHLPFQPLVLWATI